MTNTLPLTQITLVMTEIIMKLFHFEGQIILPLKVMPFCNWFGGSNVAFLVYLDSLGQETSKLLNYI